MADYLQILTDSAQAVAWTGYLKPYGLAQTFSPRATTFDPSFHQLGKTKDRT